MLELKGSEKQIKWAKNIIKEMESILEEATIYRLNNLEKKWNKKSENFKEKHNLSSIEDYKIYVSNLIEKSKKELLNNENASWYINNFCSLTSYNYDKWARVSDLSDAIDRLSDENKKLNQVYNTINSYSYYISKKSALD